MESETVGFEEERLLLKRYLSDEIAPMIFADSAAELFEVPEGVVAHEIHSWIGDQIRGASNMTAADLIYHAATKLHQLGVLELIPKEDVNAYLGGLQPHLLELCPVDQRRGLEENFQHLERSSGISGGKVEVLHKQGGGGSPHGSTATPATGYGGVGGAPGAPTNVGGAVPVQAADLVALHRLNLLLDQLQPTAAAIPAPVGGRLEPPTAAIVKPAASKEVLAQVVNEVASQAGSSKELETQLRSLKDMGIDTIDEGIFKVLSHGLPDWAPPPDTESTDKDPATGAARAMRKVVKLSKNSDEFLKRFMEFVGVAIEEFNGGSLGRAVTMVELADRMISQREIDSTIANTVIDDSYAKFDNEQLYRLADQTDKRVLLSRFMNFFPKLRVTELLEELQDAEDRDRRLRILKLLHAHGKQARELAVDALEESVNGAAPQPWQGERNLLYLMRAIPPASDSDVDREVDLLIRTSDLTGPMPVVRESFTSLVQLEHPRAFTTLAARISELEDALTGDSDTALETKDVRWLLSFVMKQLSQSTSETARSMVITHGLKNQPELGDTHARLTPLGEQDLTDTKEQLNRILEALDREQPRKILGVSVKNPKKVKVIEHLVTAVSGSDSPEVQEVLKDLIEKYPGQSFARKAEKALSEMGGAVKAETPPPADHSVTLSGDLGLFGLPNLLQNLADTGVTGTINLIDRQGGGIAKIELAEGGMISAAFGQLTDDNAVYQLLERPVEGRFEFINQGDAGEAKPKAENSRSVMSLLMDGMRRYDEFHRAMALIPDDARFKKHEKKPTDVKEDADPQLAKVVWNKAVRGVPPAEVEKEIALDAFRIRRLYEHWVTEGSLARIEDAP